MATNIVAETRNVQALQKTVPAHQVLTAIQDFTVTKVVARRPSCQGQYAITEMNVDAQQRAGLVTLTLFRASVKNT